MNSKKLIARAVLGALVAAPFPVLADPNDSGQPAIAVEHVESVQVITPSTVRHVVTPGTLQMVPTMTSGGTVENVATMTSPTVQNVVTPGAISNVVTPGAISNVVTPGAMRNVVTPGAISNVVTPGAMRDVVTPGAISNVVTPGEVRNVVTPGTVRYVVTPGSTQVMPSMVPDRRWVSRNDGATVVFREGTSSGSNMDGTVYVHPAFPGRNLFWNRNLERWCYQDPTSSSGWRFVPDDTYIPRPR